MNTTTAPTPAELITEPVHKVLAEFMDKCSPDPETREVMVSALVLGFWQMAARGMTPTPSTFLVNAGGKDDPVLGAVHRICNRDKNQGDKETDDGDAREQDTMLKAAIAEQRLRASPGPVSTRASWSKIYNDARVAGYGNGRTSTYTGAWHPQMGLVTDERNSIVLHLDEEPDLEAFRRDLLDEPQKLQAPAGISTDLDLVVKSLAVSGSIDPGQFDGKLVDAVLGLGQPYFFLPHSAQEPIAIPNHQALSYFSLKLDNTANMPVNAFPLLPQDKWVRYYQDWIWKRLCLLPSPYRFGVIGAMHQLQGVCETLALYSGPAGGEPVPEVGALARNLFTTVLRSIALSTAFLAWHGLGIELACSIRTVRKVLKLLREDGGSMKLRDVQRSVGFGTAAKRDEVIAQLEDQGLVTLDDKLVSATTMTEFIQNIREQLPIATRA